MIKDQELTEGVEAELGIMKEEGLIDTWGINSEGELVFELTKKGKRLVKKEEEL